MTERRALLIGVPECDDLSFSSVSRVVPNDLQEMCSALELSAYTIETIGLDGRDPSGSRIRAAIKKAVADAPENSTLLLYFTGHGVNVEGVDYLVPSDAYREDGSPVPALDSLVPAIPDLRRCRARLVVCFIDACRDTPASERSDPAGGGVITYPGGGGSLVMVAGCAPGQVCRFGEEGSAFTRALARALHRRNPAKTLSGVLAEVKGEMRRTTGLGDDKAQLPDAYPSAMLHSAGNLVICDGDELVSAWRRVAEDNRLWSLIPNADGPTRTKVGDLAEFAARRQLAAADRLLAQTGMVDHWFDPGYPARVIDFSAALLDGRADLSTEEAALLVAAPFLREAVLAEGITMASAIRPGDFERSYETGNRTDLELTHEMYQQVQRRAEGLARRGQHEASQTLSLWLVHRWLAGLSALWSRHAVCAALERGAVLLTDSAGAMSKGECLRLVETLVRAVAAAPVDPQLIDRLGEPSLTDDWRRDAGVLWLAGLLGSDPRRMPAVVADHIGTRLELSLASVRTAADRLRASVGDGVIDLALFCDHPAQHAAFAAMADGAQRALEALRELRGLDKRLPDRITHTRIRPDQPGSDGIPAYQEPLISFRLAEDKIRELLMGRQLYDDPSLAIRELYQNSLDACRYRATRLEGLRRQGKRPEEWTGRIVFRQGEEDGREYIECQDNGVGMNRKVLEHVFANAGERFVYLQDYRAEHALWQSLDPPLRMVSNSQFGVGVFSYFMIADEIELVTRPVERSGLLSPEAFRARIASSGSLVQVTPAEDMFGGGTRIRLYLTGDEKEKISVLQTLRQQLWIAEYQVEVVEHDAAAEVWSPGKLRYQDESAESLEYDRDLWWVSGEGGLAADGIRTNEEIHGLVVNLRDEHRPQFTVDRKKLRSWHKEWVHEKIDSSLSLLADWAGLSLSWLWEVTESAPEVAQRVFDHLVRNETTFQVGGGWGQGMDITADRVGCVPQDKELFDPSNWNVYYYARWFVVWRNGAWSGLVSGHRGLSSYPVAMSTAGFPVAEPIDGALLHRLGKWHDDREIAVDDLIVATAYKEQRMAELVRRLRRFAITGIDLSQLRRCPELPRTFDEEEAPLARALAAWTPPGMSPPSVVAGWLIKTSVDLDLPLKEVVRRATELAPPGWTAPDLDLTDLGRHICTLAEAKIVSTRLSGSPPWVKGPLGPDHLAHAAGTLGRDLEQILEMCDRLAPLGVTVEGRELFPAHFERVEVEALRHLSRVGAPLTAMKLVSVAAWAAMSITEAWEALTPLAERGLLRLPALPEGANLTPNTDVLAFINYAMQTINVSTGRRVFLPAEPCLAVAAGLSGRFWRGGPANRLKGLVPFTLPEKELGHVDLINLASMIYGSIGDARRYLTDAYPDIRLPPVIEETKELQPWLTVNYLITPQAAMEPTDWLIDTGEIVEGAASFGMSVGGFLEAVAPYKALGAPIPEPSAESLQDFADWHPDAYDIDLLGFRDAKKGYTDFLQEVGAFQLVLIAGRLGLELAETHRRLARMMPLGLRISYPAEAVPEGIVRWQDLLLLTVHLDGRAPVVSGVIGREWLDRVADQTGESVAWLVERVRIYAPLFSLTLAEEFANGRA